MTPSTGIGVYPGSATAVENDEVSSTYEGRHLTFLASDITGHEHAVVTKGHPVCIGEHIVGVAFQTEVNAADLITIDTEGIWNLKVAATDQDGNNAVVAGDELFIGKTTGLLSKNNNKLTQAHFGYALGSIAAGSTFTIAVKVHWNPEDIEELVGQDAVPFTSLDASHRFREYHYEAQGGGYPKGDYLKLTITTAACNSAQALRRVLAWTADDNWVTGYAAVGEFDLEVAAGAGAMDTTCVIFLTSNIGPLTGTGHNNYELSWIRIHDYAGVQGDQVNNLFEINDTLAGYPYAASTDDLFITLAGDVAPTHALKFTVNAVEYWILCRNAIT